MQLISLLTHGTVHLVLSIIAVETEITSFLEVKAFSMIITRCLSRVTMLVVYKHKQLVHIKNYIPLKM